MPTAATLLALAGCEKSLVSVVDVAGVEVSPARVTLQEGARETLSAVVSEQGGAALPGPSVTWSADDPDVATVSSEGVVEGLSPGSTKVHAESGGVRGTAEIVVVRGPTLTASVGTIALEASEDDSATITTEVDIDNAGAGSLDGLTARVSAAGGGSASWLRADLLDDAAPTKLRLRASAEGLGAGSYEAVVTVEPEAGSSPAVAVSVRLEVRERTSSEPACAFRDRTFGEDVEIPRNTTCTLTRVHVRGDLKLERGARLTAVELTVDGKIEAEGAEQVVLRDARIGGNVELEKGGDVEVRGARISGTLKVASNQGTIELRGNVVGKDLKLEKNRGGPFLLVDNEVDEDLECKENAPPPSGSGNRVGGKTKGQCRSL